MLIFKKNNLFRKLMKGIVKFKQDTVFHTRRLYIKKNELLYKKDIIQQDMHSYYFFNNNNTFNKNNCNIKNIINKKIYVNLYGNGYSEYYPQIVLDLHGSNQYEAKKNIGSLITLCYKEFLSCAGILHGYGKQILKTNIPFWLTQHPNVCIYNASSNSFKNHNMIIIFLLNVNK